MNPDCNLLNPLQRDGTSQNQRLVRALHPSSVLVDERDTGQLLLYARDYAELIRYYSLENKPEGNWRIFIDCDVSTLVAIIANSDLDSIRTEFNDLLENIRGESLVNKIAAYADLFGPIRQLLVLSDQWCYQAIEGLKLKTACEKLIKSILNDVVKVLVANSLRAVEVGGMTTAFQSNFLLSDAWSLDNIQADPTLFASGAPIVNTEIDTAIDRIELEFEKFYEALQTIIQQAPTFLEETLNDYPEHEPHMALFLSFLSLCKVAQDHMNTITRKHLNFYYKDVLQLEPLPERPDEVHLILELAKSFHKQLLKEDTAFKAGKDGNGVNLFYNSDAEIVANRTKLAEEIGLRSLYIDKDYGTDLPVRDTAFEIKNIYAAPIANSADGQGAELDEEGKWLTLGGTSMPYATVGFAIASPIFLLQEAQRDITIDLFFEKPATWTQVGTDIDEAIAHELRHNIKVYYSGEKEWIEAIIESCTLEIPEAGMLKMTFTIHLDSGAELVLGYNDKVLQDGLNTHQPVIKFVMDNDGLAASYLCFGMELITSKVQAETVFPEVVQQMILNFLNAPPTADDWAMIAGIEPQDGPVFDNEGIGPIPGYDIGETVARAIINTRNGFLVGGTYTHISQLYDIPGLGIDKFNDLFFTFCGIASDTQSISKTKENALPFNKDKDYLISDVVSYDNNWYMALTPISGAYPSPESSKWMLLEKSYPYKYFQELDFYQMKLTVEVSEVRNLILENDVGVLNPAKPFFPFGPIPKVGSKFFIGHPEAFNKHLKNVEALESLIVELTWADLPTTSFPAHYTHYTLSTQVSDDNVFTVDIEVLENGEWHSVTTGISLFDDNDNANQAPSGSLQIDLSDLLSSRAPDGEPFTNLTTLLERGFVRLKLNNAFLHKNYPTSITHAVLNSPANIPNEPYTPTISEVKMTYRSSETINYNDLHAGTFEDRYEQLFHIEPFGWKEIYPIPNSSSTDEYVVTQKLLPEFKVSEAIDLSHPDPETTDAEGSLYIGLKELVPEQNVSILFQVAEGSADPEKNTQDVVWSYLANNQWIDFDRSEIVSDATNGLLNSGIITFVMTKAMTSANTSHPAENFWIKASVARQTAAINQMIAVMPQAVKATFAKQDGNDLDRLSDSLAAETIAKLKNRQAAFKSVVQPFASFNGKVAETDEAPEGLSGEEVFDKTYNEFYIRISERLRHKNRGITIWDYERMVLQKFPEVYKVKCINHTRSFDGVLPVSEYAPGHVKVIVMPNLHNQNAIDPLRPMISLAKLDEIKNYLQPLISDFVNLEVKNPQFERIKVTFNVKFLEGKDKGFYLNKLNQDIIQFLSPWIYKEGEDLALGGKIHRSVILNFIEETDYVDYLTEFKMDHIISKDKILCDVEEAIASTSSSVIVSDQEHDINPDIHIECKT